ncbi:hypothetical protein FRX31_020218 [Thalictrum thalictroides]|uniref:Uncharacterized protein n=1 Tax=Thalictrum thalictroides TaxID=46969 RepID=A0A7J6W1J2_THATH|nr:hypothetical protein FRX31_020218 [Thalictrum thalictroides]
MAGGGNQMQERVSRIETALTNLVGETSDAQNNGDSVLSYLLARLEALEKRNEELVAQVEGMADDFEKLVENTLVELDFKAHTSSSAEAEEKKDNGKTRSKGCFICDGPHLAKACPRKEELDVLETEGESDEVSKEDSDEGSEGDSDEESEGEEVVAGVPEHVLLSVDEEIKTLKTWRSLRNFPGVSAFNKAQCLSKCGPDLGMSSLR